MLPNSNTQSVQGGRSIVGTVSVRLFTVVVFACLFAMSTTSVGAVSSYSDSWVDNPYQEPDSVARNTSGVYIVGCGVTEANYDDDWELHSIKVTTTIRSPNGRSFTLSTRTWNNHSTYSAVAEPKLQFSSGDLGTYTTTSHHYSTCPSTDFGYTSIPLYIGLSAESYTGLIPIPGFNACKYTTPTCIGRCTKPDGALLRPVNFAAGEVCQEYMQGYHITVNGICVFAFGDSTSVPGECY